MKSLNISTLYKRAKTGKISQWTIQIHPTEGAYRTIQGYVGMKMTTSQWTFCQSKNVGKTIETSPRDQAEKEIQSKIEKQIKKNYVESLENVDKLLWKEPMLAYKWKDYGHKMTKLIAIQPKLDGIRCIATKDGLFTRTGKRIVSVPHIERAVKFLLDGLTLDVRIDGELYNHELKEDFNKIVSIVRKQKPTEEDLQLSQSHIQYHIYDVEISQGQGIIQSFGERFQTIKSMVDMGRMIDEGPRQDLEKVKVVKTAFLEQFDQDVIDDLYGSYLNAGYEGQMIRSTLSHYKNGRSQDLLKRKEFQDEEFKIIDIEEGVGNRSGMMGRVVFDGFKANARGTHDYFKQLLVNKDQYIGKIATVRFQNRTPDGSLRFPVMVGIRDYE